MVKMSRPKVLLFLDQILIWDVNGQVLKFWHLKTFLQIFVLWNITDSQYIIHGRMSHFFPKPNKIYFCQNRLQYWFHKAKWMSNTFPSYNLASELGSRVSGLMFILVLSNLQIVIRNHRHILYLDCIYDQSHVIF